ncbi:MAG: hypothetical protein ACYTGX_12245 [Planctomycetota bacterium]
MAAALGLTVVLGSGCVGYEVQRATTTDEVVLSSRATGLAVDGRRIAANQLHVRLVEQREVRTQVTTTATDTVEFTYGSITDELLSRQHGTANKAIWSLMFGAAFLSIDGVLWVCSAPFAYPAGAIAAIDPGATVEENTRAEEGPLAGGSRPGVAVTAGSTALELVERADRAGWVRLAVTGGPRVLLRNGTEQLEFTLTHPEDAGARVSLRLQLDDVMALNAPSSGLTPAAQRDWWRSCYTETPASATRLRAAIWGRLEPLERTIPVSTRAIKLVGLGEGPLPGRPGRRLRAARRFQSTYRAGVRERYHTEPLPPGSELITKMNGATISFRPKVQPDGYFIIALSKGSAAKWLREGRELTHFTFWVPDAPASSVAWKLSCDSLARYASEEISGSEADRLQQWTAIYEACPAGKTKVRAAIQRFLAPLQQAAAARAKRASDLARVTAELRGGSAFPAGAQARAARLQQQTQRAELLLQSGDRRGAAMAFGEAARHASDLDDLDALERLVQRQIAARRAR